MVGRKIAFQSLDCWERVTEWIMKQSTFKHVIFSSVIPHLSVNIHFIKRWNTDTIQSCKTSTLSLCSSQKMDTPGRLLKWSLWPTVIELTCQEVELACFWDRCSLCVLGDSSQDVLLYQHMSFSHAVVFDLSRAKLHFRWCSTCRG